MQVSAISSDKDFYLAAYTVDYLGEGSPDFSLIREQMNSIFIPRELITISSV